LLRGLGQAARTRGDIHLRRWHFLHRLFLYGLIRILCQKVCESAEACEQQYLKQEMVHNLAG
jgi:hypothetical protein